MVISELVVEVNTASKELFRETDGEKFYKMNIHFRGGDIFAVISEYLLTEVNGKAKICGYLQSSTIKEPREHLFTYFRVTEMIEVASDTPLTNHIDISGKITKIHKLVTRTNGKQVLPVVISRMNADGTTSVLHASFVDAAARKLNAARDKKYNVTADGAISSHYSAIEVCIDNYSLTERS